MYSDFHKLVQDLFPEVQTFVYSPYDRRDKNNDILDTYI